MWPLFVLILTKLGYILLKVYDVNLNHYHWVLQVILSPRRNYLWLISYDKQVSPQKQMHFVCSSFISGGTELKLLVFVLITNMWLALNCSYTSGWLICNFRILTMMHSANICFINNGYQDPNNLYMIVPITFYICWNQVLKSVP